VLYFSDVPRNVVFIWKKAWATRDYLFRAAYTGAHRREGCGSGAGSNGLTLDSLDAWCSASTGIAGWRVSNQARASSRSPSIGSILRFNSPNDLVYAANGDLYFTDPTYGLPRDPDDANRLFAQELLFSGVYLLRRSGEVCC